MSRDELKRAIEEAAEIANNYAVPEGGESGQACADIAEMLTKIIQKLEEENA